MVVPIKSEALHAPPVEFGNAERRVAIPDLVRNRFGDAEIQPADV
jgi:hypothetical protein